MYKVYKVQMNSHGAPNFSTAEETVDRPQGEWIYNGNFCGMNHHKCSVCGRTEFRMSAYCPNCGAKMKGADDE